MVKVTLKVEDNGKWRQSYQVLRLTDVAKVSPALVYWTSKQIDMQYRSTGSGVLIVWECAFDTGG